MDASASAGAVAWSVSTVESEVEELGGFLRVFVI